jgi:3-methyl-2-oxobutanoate hydroxymethyltransferase
MSSDTKSKVTVPKLTLRKGGEKITMLTAYDYPTALLVDDSGVDIVFVGDSLGCEELGYDSTIRVTMDDMLHHCRAVRRGVKSALLLVDMPFLSYQISPEEAVRNAGRLLQEGGANAVKLEGGTAIGPTIRRIVDAGIPVMGHVGYQPQSTNITGVAKQGKDEEGAARVVEDALAVEGAGAFAVVLELVPSDLAQRVTGALKIPTIGIGAGPHCDGQVLVISDMIGLRPAARPLRHVKVYAHVGDEIARAGRAFKDDVVAGRFPE